MSYQLETNGVFKFSDSYKQSSSYVGDFFVSDNAADWNALHAAHPGKSLIEILALVGTGGGGGDLQAAYDSDTRIAIATSTDPGNGGPIDITIPNGTNESALKITNNDTISKPPSVVIENFAASTQPWEAPSILLTGTSYNSVMGLETLTIGGFGFGPTTTLNAGAVAMSGVAQSEFSSVAMSGAATTTLTSQGSTASTRIGANSSVNISVTPGTGVVVEPDTNDRFFVNAAGTGDIFLQAQGADIQFTTREGGGYSFNSLGTASNSFRIRNQTTDMVLFTPAGLAKYRSKDGEPIHFASSGEVWFEDEYHDGSTWTLPILLAASTAEWDTLRTKVGQVSLINAISQAYDAGGGGGGGTPGGTSTEIQYRVDASTFGGSPVAFYDVTDSALVIGRSTVPRVGTADLWVTKQDAVSTLAISSASGTEWHSPQLQMIRYDGSFGLPNAIDVNDVLGTIGFKGATDASNVRTGAYIYVYAGEDWSEAGRGTRLRIYVTKNGGTNPLTRYYVDNLGNQHLYYNGLQAGLTVRDSEEGFVFGSGTSDPTGVNGAVYYNASTNKFRAYQNSAWIDMIGTGTGGGTPAGSNTEIQYRVDSSTFGAAAANWDTTYSSLVMGDATSAVLQSSDYKIQVIKDSGQAHLAMVAASSTYWHTGMLQFVKAHGTIASPTAVQSDDQLGYVSFLGATTPSLTSGVSYGAQIYAQATQAWSGTAVGTSLKFATATNGTTTLEERYVIDGTGDHFWYGAGTTPAQLFKLDDTNLYAFGPSRAGEPTAVEGAFFYDTAADAWKFGQGSTPSWVTFGAGGSASPGGASTEIQYRVDDTTFGGASSAFWDVTNSAMLIGDLSSRAWANDFPLWLSNNGYTGIPLLASGTATEYPQLLFVSSNGTVASPTATVADDELGQIFFGGLTASGWDNRSYGVAIRAVAYQNYATNPSTTLQLRTIQSGSSSRRVRYEINGGGDHIWYSSGGTTVQHMRLDDSCGTLVASSLDWSPTDDSTVGFWAAREEASSSISISSAHSTGSGTPSLRLYKVRGTHASFTPAQSGDNLGGMYVASFTGTSWSSHYWGASINAIATEAHGAGAAGTGLQFSTMNNSAVTSSAVRYEIDGASHHYFYGAGGSPVQLFELDATNNYAVIPSRAGEPAVENGAFFYDTTANAWKFGENGSWATLGGGSGGGETLQQTYDLGSSVAVSVSEGPIDITIPNGVNSRGLQITNNNTTNKPYALYIANNAAPAQPWEAASIYLAGTGNFNSIMGSGALFTGAYAPTVNPAQFYGAAYAMFGAATTNIVAFSGGSTATVFLDASGVGGASIEFRDSNKTASTLWPSTPNLQLSANATEWDDYVTRYGQVSILSAFSKAYDIGNSIRIQMYTTSTAECNVAKVSALQIPFTNETYKDSDFTHSTTVNPEQITINTAGRYRLSYMVTHENNSSNRKNILTALYLNGGEVVQTEVAFVTDSTIDKQGSNTMPSYEGSLSAGDVITLRAWGIGSTGSCTLVSSRTWIRIERIF